MDEQALVKRDETGVQSWREQPIKTVEDALNAVVPHIGQLAPKSLDVDKWLTLLRIELLKTPELWECDPMEVAKLVIEAASLGLEPGNEVYFTAFFSKRQNRYLASKMVGFQGWYRILAESPRIRKVVTDVVCKGDDFYQDRMNDEYRHVVPQDAPRTTITHAYCVVTLTNGEKLYRILDKSDLDRHQASAQNGGSTGPWQNHYATMAMKSALQSFAGRHKGLLNAIAREAVEQDETALQIEYDNTPPDPVRVDRAIADLFGDREQNDPRMALRQPEDLPFEEEPVDTVTGEILSPAPKPEQVLAALRKEVVETVKQLVTDKRMTPQEQKNLAHAATEGAARSVREATLDQLGLISRYLERTYGEHGPEAPEEGPDDPPTEETASQKDIEKLQALLIQRVNTAKLEPIAVEHIITLAGGEGQRIDKIMDIGLLKKIKDVMDRQLDLAKAE